MTRGPRQSPDAARTDRGLQSTRYGMVSEIAKTARWLWPGALAVVFFTTSAAGCGSSLAKIQSRLAYFSKLNLNFAGAEPEPLDFEPTTGVGRWKGFEVEVFVPGAKHHQGIQHAGLYRVKRPDGNTIIKVLGNLGEKTRNESLIGPLLAQSVGGPRVIEVGTLSSRSGTTSYFIEMEEMFPGEDTRTFKGFFREGNRNKPDAERYPHIRELLGGTPRLTKQLADLLVRAYAAGLVPNTDVDVIFSDRGAAWIDTTGWTHTKEITKESLGGVHFTRFFIESADKEAGAAFKEDWRKAVEENQDLSESTRRILRMAL